MGGRVRAAHIQLHHFVANSVTGVFHPHAHHLRAVGAGFDLQPGIDEWGVTKTVAEGEKRFTGEISVGAALHIVTVKGRQVPFRLVESDRQAPGRIVIAKQDIRHGLATARSGIPRFQNRRHMRGGPRDSHRRAAH